jgi:hypothetical protein
MPTPTPKPAPPRTAPPKRERPAPVLFKDWASI